MRLATFAVTHNFAKHRTEHLGWRTWRCHVSFRQTHPSSSGDLSQCSEQARTVNSQGRRGIQNLSGFDQLRLGSAMMDEGIGKPALNPRFASKFLCQFLFPLSPRLHLMFCFGFLDGWIAFDFGFSAFLFCKKGKNVNMCQTLEPL